jgi:hypothetical protein
MIDGAREEIAHGTETMLQTEPIEQFAVPHVWAHDFNILGNYMPLEVEKWKSWVSGLDLRKKAGSFIHR